jgi:hypothetical protein
MGRGDTLNLPPRSPDLRPLDYYYGERVNNVVYERKVDIEDELLQQISDAARHVNNPTDLRKVTRSLVKRTRYYIQAYSGHFEQLT